MQAMQLSSLGTDALDRYRRRARRPEGERGSSLPELLPRFEKSTAARRLAMGLSPDGTNLV
jgi:hypothetical protein